MVTDEKRRKRLYIILPVATLAVIAAILIPIIILNRPISHPVRAPEKFTRTDDGYAFGAISAARLALYDGERGDALCSAAEYLDTFDGFWNNDEYLATVTDNTDESVPYRVRSTVRGTEFDGKDFGYSLYYTEKVDSSSELLPGDGSAAKTKASEITAKTVKYIFRGVLPIDKEVVKLDGERTADDNLLSVTAQNGDGTRRVTCTRTLYDNDGMTAAKFEYSIVENDVTSERATFKPYATCGFELEVAANGTTHKYTVTCDTDKATLSTDDGKTYKIEKRDGKYTFAE